MGRVRRDETPGSIKHVYCRGNRGELVFEDDGDYAAFTEKLFELANKMRIDILAFCLMPNHFHLCVRKNAEGATLAKFMQRLNLWHARQYNSKHGVRGRLNESRYRAKIVDSDSYLINLVRYIHLNAVRAGIVATVGEWKHCSHAMYLGKCKNPGVATGLVFEKLGGVAGYRACFENPVVSQEDLEHFRFKRQKTPARLPKGVPVAPHLKGPFGERVRLVYELTSRGHSQRELALKLQCGRTAIGRLLAAAIPDSTREVAKCSEQEEVYRRAA